MTTDLTVPEQSVKDWLYGTGKGLIGSVPLAGNLCAELFTLMLTPPIQKRQAQWQRRVAEVLVELQTTRGVDLDKLRDDPAFADVLVQATRIALTTAQDDKLKALRNAVYNAAACPGPDDFRGLFLGWVDRFTEWHLRIIAVAAEPAKYLSHGSPWPESLLLLLEQVLPPLADAGLRDQLWSDLHASGLVRLDSLYGPGVGNDFHNSKLTDLGEKFLAFIESPMD
jgi:hypothetical protein